MVQVVEQNPTDLILVMADMARANPPLSGAFLAEMTRHLQGQSPHFAFANSWLEQRLSEQGLTIEQLVQADGQAQAADQVSMGNSITSLRFLSSNDWREFVENHSLVEQILREDPRLRRHGFRHARPLPPCRGGDRQAKSVLRTGRRAQGDSNFRPRARGERRSKRRSAGDALGHLALSPHLAPCPRRLLPDRPGPCRAGDERRRALASVDERCPGSVGRFPLFAYLFGVLLITVIVTRGLPGLVDPVGRRGNCSLACSPSRS